jgi:hypothetical protein
MSMKDESGKTPLMYAAQYGCEEIVEASLFNPSIFSLFFTYKT